MKRFFEFTVFLAIHVVWLSWFYLYCDFKVYVGLPLFLLYSALAYVSMAICYRFMLRDISAIPHSEKLLFVLPIALLLIWLTPLTARRQFYSSFDKVNIGMSVQEVENIMKSYPVVYHRDYVPYVNSEMSSYTRPKIPGSYTGEISYVPAPGTLDHGRLVLKNGVVVNKGQLID